MSENAQILWAVLAAAVLVNLVLTGYCLSKLRGFKQLKQADLVLEKAQITMRSDSKALFDSAKGLGMKLTQVERLLRNVEERQDQLSLKEPSEQTYRHSVRLIKSGLPVDKVVEQSGLSRGEVELLLLLNRIEGGDGATHDETPSQSNSFEMPR